MIESWRSGGNQRRYERAVLRRVAIIRVAQAVGIPLAEIRRRLDSLPAGKAGWTKLAGAWRADLDRRIALLSRLRDRLESCIGCGCLSVDDCPLRNPEDRAAGEGPGPRHLVEALAAIARTSVGASASSWRSSTSSRQGASARRPAL
ncbi:MAG: redox-sensitive transcriptional activator SoxR [Sphingosinicella sp.]|uniref:redox-sensitive transcriptional activator SoxR n=1 Tax=Sphingosinicella sp. TaxID=1917971 RepID=UPI004037E890